MSPTPLDSTPGADHHGHESRIAKLEAGVDNLGQAVTTLRVDMNEGFRSLRAAMDAHRAEMRHDLQRLEDKFDQKLERQHKDSATERRWMMGLLIANLLATLGFAAKTLALI